MAFFFGCSKDSPFSSPFLGFRWDPPRDCPSSTSLLRAVRKLFEPMLFFSFFFFFFSSRRKVEARPSFSPYRQGFCLWVDPPPFFFFFLGMGAIPLFFLLPSQFKEIVPSHYVTVSPAFPFFFLFYDERTWPFFFFSV